MLILLPVGHETRVQRYPYVTIGIMIFSLIVFIPAWLLDIKYAAKMQEVAEKIYEINPAYFESQNYRENIEEATGYSLDLSESQAELLRELEREFEELEASRPAYKFGCVPAKWNPVTAITSIFMHGGWLHLIGNMLFLWMVGCNIEDKWGPWFFLLFYLVGGMIATIAHSIAHPDNVPLIGASGAVAAVMGAFLVRYAKTKIHFVYLLLIFIIPKKGKFSAPAYVMLPLWFLLEILSKDLPDGTAHLAHVGGFAFGMISGLVLLYSGLEAKYFTPKYGLQEVEHEIPADYQLAQLLLSQGKKEEAIKYFKETALKNNNYIPALAALTKIYADDQNRAEYLKASESLAKQAMAIKENNILLELMQRTIKAFPDMSFNAVLQFRVAGELAGMMMFQEAVHAYRNIAHACPGEMLALKSLLAAGDILTDKMGMPENGAEMYQYLATYFPDSQPAEIARQKLEKIKHLIPTA